MDYPPSSGIVRVEGSRLGEVIVSLTGIPASEAYEWGMEAGAFLHTVHMLDPDGVHEFHAGNIGMLVMIAGERGYEVEMMGPAEEAGMVRCVVRPWNKSRPPYLKIAK